MATQVLMRPVFNRPEMLYLSIEAEINAREYHKFPDDLLTLFIVEHGADPITVELVRRYPFRSYCILRADKYGLSCNILEGFREAFSLTNDYIIYIEDDVVVHKTYFKYMDTLLNMDLGKVSVLSAYNFDDDGDIHEIRRKNHYSALAPIIMKDFYTRYILSCSCNDFYSDPAGFSIALNDKYKEHWATKRYRYQDSTHHAQAGIINRLTDVAEIEEDMWCIMPSVNRQTHIGFWGANRVKSKDIPGVAFDERVDNLREIVKDADKMYDMAGSKEYDDYKTFSSKLEAWDGTLRMV
jgi:hypothetical protein